jgi:hypothetical protein
MRSSPAPGTTRRSNAACSAASSASRPIIRVSTPSMPRVAMRKARGLARSTSQLCTGASTPLTASGGCASTSKTPRTCR